MSKKKEKKRYAPGTMVSDFEIYSLIGQGGYGDIYSVHRPKEDTVYAMKIEELETTHKGLEQEIEVLKNLQDSPCFPKIITCGHTDTLRYLVMELYGLSVSNTRRLTDTRSLSLGTTTRIAIYMLDCIQELHKHGYIHRDIKPGNFLFRNNGKNPLVLIDFGFGRRYIDKKTKQLIPERSKPGFRGTSKYASLNAHEYNDQSRRDDLISWGYSIVELFNGKLPWSKAKDNNATRIMKYNIKDDELFKGMPEGFKDIWSYLDSLDFSDTPKYCIIREMLIAILEDAKVKYNDPFDWESIPQERMLSFSQHPDLPNGEDIEVSFQEVRKVKEISNDLIFKSRCCNI